jgi:uncharacterized protein
MAGRDGSGYWIDLLNLQPHPEGGHYSESYRSGECAELSRGKRPFCTAIYYLLHEGEASRFHRIRSDEIWHHYAGGVLRLYVLQPGRCIGEEPTDTEIHRREAEPWLETLYLGDSPSVPARLQVVVPAGLWFAAEPIEGSGFCLSGCTVSPGFDFADFELAGRGSLTEEYPAHAELIRRLT